LGVSDCEIDDAEALAQASEPLDVRCRQVFADQDGFVRGAAVDAHFFDVIRRAVDGEELRRADRLLEHECQQRTLVEYVRVHDQHARGLGFALESLYTAEDTECRSWMREGER